MRSPRFILALACALVAAGGSSVHAAPTGGMDRAVIQEINRARIDPRGYAEELRALPPSPELDDAIAFLERQAPVPPLRPDARLHASAAAHAAEQGPAGRASHDGRDGARPMARMRRAGMWASIYAEVISLSEDTPQGVVRQLIVDPIPNHPHRVDLFDPNLQFAGVGCGDNARYGRMCVIDMSNAPVAR